MPLRQNAPIHIWRSADDLPGSIPHWYEIVALLKEVGHRVYEYSKPSAAALCSTIKILCPLPDARTCRFHTWSILTPDAERLLFLPGQLPAFRMQFLAASGAPAIAFRIARIASRRDFRASPPKACRCVECAYLGGHLQISRNALQITSVDTFILLTADRTPWTSSLVASRYSARALRRP